LLEYKMSLIIIFLLALWDNQKVKGYLKYLYLKGRLLPLLIFFIPSSMKYFRAKHWTSHFTAKRMSNVNSMSSLLMCPVGLMLTNDAGYKVLDYMESCSSVLWLSETGVWS
jgi:hypothetical protein